MKFSLPACDHDYSEGLKSGTINGGTVLLDHIAYALRNAGHEAEVVALTANYEGDYIIIQSEWIGMPNVRDFKSRGGKVITLCGHFISHVYPKIETVKELSDLMLTQWTGELLEGFDVKFWPHAYSDLTDSGEKVYKGDIVWAGNPYQLRDEGYFAGIQGITPIRGTYPKDLFPMYRAASVCPNIHGDFQKNIVSTAPSKIADKPGTMINERFWSILGCGGVLVTDWTPQMEMFFEKDELITADTKEEFQELVKYYSIHKQEGLNKLAKAREKVRANHTYKERVKELLSWI